MKLEFLNRSESERAPFLQETAARRGLLPVMVEKDFWVSWTLAALFAHPEFGGQLVFKGGTSLSKVFGVIDRFSEDIDLSVSPALLGISEEWVEEPGSRKRTEARMHELEAACIGHVRGRFLPELERIAIEALGTRSGGRAWMKFEVDDSTGSPVVLFHYPSASPTVSSIGALRENGVRSANRSTTCGQPSDPAMGGRRVSQTVRGFPLRSGGTGPGADVLGKSDDPARGTPPGSGRSRCATGSHGITPIWRHWHGIPSRTAHWLATICACVSRIGRAGSLLQAGRGMIWPPRAVSISCHLVPAWQNWNGIIMRCGTCSFPRRRPSKV